MLIIDMKTQIIHKTKIFSLLLCCALFLAGLNGCDSDKVGENFYTFTGETVGSYLDANPETFGEFNKAIEIAGLSALMKTYNQYTCFIPTNEAMREYYKNENVDSLSLLTDSVVRQMVYTHLIPNQIYTSEYFVDGGTFVATDMNSRLVTTDFRTGDGKIDVYINGSSKVINKDIGVEGTDTIINGVIHVIDRVLTPSIALIPDMLASDSRISLFSEAMEATQLHILLKDYEDKNYVMPTTDAIAINGSTVCRWPKERKVGYTVFVESDEVFASKGIKNLEDLKVYAAKIYDEMYPQDASISDITDRKNSLNRFISYHIIDRTIPYNNFFFKANMDMSQTLYEFLETFCPNTILKVSNDNGGVVINSDAVRSVKGVSVLAAESGYDQVPINGVYHLIDDILVYDQKVKTMLLNTRIRIDATALHPEMMTNRMRTENGGDPAGVTGEENYYRFPDGYLKNVVINSNNTSLFYLQGNASSGGAWINYQADEMMAKGQYDFTMRLPPVPAGTYEIRFGYSANNNRAITQFYVDNEPQGIPLDLRITADQPKIGWVADSSTQDEGLENDKMMRNRGYMKGGTAYMAGSASARTAPGAIRRIVCTKTWTEDGAHYIRFKSVSEDAAKEFMIDFFEYVPKNVYENPNGLPEDKS